MRKPRPAATRTIVLAVLALILVASCDEARTPGTVVASQMGAGGRGANAPSGFAPTVARDMAVEVPMAAKAEAAQPSAAPANASSAASPSLGRPMPAVDPTGAMIVRHGEASVQVQALDPAVARIRQTASQFGGFVGNTSLVAGKEEQKTATLELRIPSGQFDAVVGALNQLGKVETVTVSAEDVSEEYVDLGARLANARRVEARLVEMLATRTGKLSDVLTVEQELARVRQEAERYEARIRWLEHRASLSSLSVSLHEKIPLIEPPRGHGPIAEAFAEAWTRFVAFVAWFIASLGILIPAGAVIGVMIMVTRRLFGGGSPPKVPLV